MLSSIVFGGDLPLKGDSENKKKMNEEAYQYIGNLTVSIPELKKIKRIHILSHLLPWKRNTIENFTKRYLD